MLYDKLIKWYIKGYKKKLQSILFKHSFVATRTYIRRDTPFTISIQSDQSFMLNDKFKLKNTEPLLKLYGFELLEYLRIFLSNSRGLNLKDGNESHFENNTAANFETLLNLINNWNLTWYFKLILRRYKLRIVVDYEFKDEMYFKGYVVYIGTAHLRYYKLLDIELDD